MPMRSHRSRSPTDSPPGPAAPQRCFKLHDVMVTNGDRSGRAFGGLAGVDRAQRPTIGLPPQPFVENSGWARQQVRLVNVAKSGSSRNKCSTSPARPPSIDPNRLPYQVPYNAYMCSWAWCFVIEIATGDILESPAEASSALSTQRAHGQRHRPGLRKAL